MLNTTKQQRIALVPGASSGLGAAFAERLAHDQYDLIVVARRKDRLDALAQILRAKYRTSVEVLVADLTLKDQLETVERRITDEMSIELLVNNAGFGGYQSFLTLDPDKADELIRLQVTALTRLTRAVLPSMVARKRGSIINVSSRLAFTGTMTLPSLPKRATYAATKSFVNTFSQILASELAGSGIRVQALCPGVIRTEFHELMGIDPSRFPPSIVMKPEDVVDASLKGLELGETLCIPSLEDSGLIDRLHESAIALVERSSGNAVADRYG